MTEAVANLIELQTLDNDVARGRVEATPYRKRKRRTLMRHIPDSTVRVYDRLRMRHTDAVVPVVDGACQGCFVQLPALVRVRLQNPREKVTCDHCGRILYVPERG